MGLSGKYPIAARARRRAAAVSPRRGGRGGFTILELLTATAILGLLMVLLTSVFSMTQQGLTALSNKARQRQSAQVVLANLAKELRMAVTPARGTFEGANSASRQIQLLINPLGVGAEFQNAHSIFWPAGVASDKGGSGLIGYVVRWEATPGTAPQPRLCRIFVNAGETQSILAALKTPGGEPQWADTDLVNQSAPGDLDNGYQGWLTDNILALYVRALDPEMKPITAFARKIDGVTFDSMSQSSAKLNSSTVGVSCGDRFDSREGYQYKSGNTLINCFGPALPAAVELVVVSATPKAIRNLTNIPAPVSSGDPVKLWEDVDQFVTSLPGSVRPGVNIHSTIVPLGK